MPPTQVELVFPLRGINDNWAFGRQPEGTTPDAQNVIPFDSLDSRARGGQRWGLSKYYETLHNGANAIQALTSNALSVEPTAASTATFTQANGVLSDTAWYPLVAGGSFSGFWTVSAAEPLVASNAISRTNAEGVLPTAGIFKTAGNTTVNYDVTADVTLNPGGDGAKAIVGLIVRADTDFPDVQRDVDLIFCRVQIWFVAPSTYNLRVEYSTQAGNNFTSTAMTPGSGDYLDPTWWTTAKTLKISVRGDVVSFYAGTTLLTQNTIARQSGSTAVGFEAQASVSAATTITLDNFSLTPVASQSTREYKIISVSGGDVYTGSPFGALALATSGENVVSTTGRVGLQSAFGKVYLCDGVNANYSVWTASTDTVAAWTPDGGDVLPVSDAQGARYIALYRGRIVLSGLIGDPHNWFMSAAGDPLDWDYGGSLSATMAVAGNSTDAGKCPDIITCLAPYSDDLLFLGGDHTLWLMRGDPADRGRIDNISYQTGISGPDAFSFDPNGVFYFFGMGTLWRMTPGGVPEPLSRGRVDRTFEAIDLTTNTVNLVWDNIRHGLHIFVVPAAEGSTTHYYWDERTDGFWKIAIPNAHGPTAVLAFDGDNPDDNAVILGGWDGYLRRVDSAVSDDDGTAVSSYVLYPPISVGGAARGTRLNRATVVLDTNSDAAVFTVYAEETAQKTVESSTVRFARTLTAGGRTRILQRTAGNAIMFRISNSVDETTWAIETILAEIEAVGLSRKQQL